MVEKIQFDKPALTLEKQLELLKNRNLIINDVNEARHYLSTIGYYRLMAYFTPFLLNPENSSHGFKQNILFRDILNLYIFDRELRLLVTDGLERIQVALRAAISNVMSIKYGSHWYENPNLFNSLTRYNIAINEMNEHLRRTKENSPKITIIPIIFLSIHQAG